MAQWSPKSSKTRRDEYDSRKAEAFAILRDAAVGWAKGNPGQPPVEEILDRVLEPFIDSRFLNRPA